MRHPYLVDLNNPDDWLYPIELIGPDGHKGEDQRTIHMPEGPDRLFHVTDSIMYPAPPDRAATDLHCHEHQSGWEDFFVDSGSMDLFVNGMKVVVTAGSIIHLQPFEAHGMNFHTPVKYRGFFHGLSNSDNSPYLAAVRADNPDVMSDPEFPPRDRQGEIDIFMRETPIWKDTPVEQCTTIRHINRPLAAFMLDGVTLKMITARWENGGHNEMWAFEMDKSFTAASDKYPLHTDMYYITSGQVKFTVINEEFTAGPECIVKIPKFARYTATALSDAVMYDVGGLPRWQAYLYDRESILLNAPDRAKDPATFKELRDKFGVQLVIG